MTLDEAIQHAEEVALSKEKQIANGDWTKGSLTEIRCEQCAKDHRQLANYLKELRALRKAWAQLVDTAIEVRDNAVDNQDSDTNARDVATFFSNYLSVLEKGIIKEVE